MRTLTAGQIGASYGAYTGRDAQFTAPNGKTVQGTISRSDGGYGKYTYLWINGSMWTLPNSTTITFL